MYIGNVGIFVKDLKGARQFFESYFGAKFLKSYNEPENNYYSDILELDKGAWIELMTKPEIVDAPKDPNRSGLAPAPSWMTSWPALRKTATRSSTSRPTPPASAKCAP